MRVASHVTPRRWQREALDCWAARLSGIAKVVTGGGKTVFAYLCLEQFFSEYPEGRALIVVPTLALLDQWFVDITEATTITEEEVACYSGGSRPEEPAKVNLLVLNTARTFAEQISYGTPSMLVVDECHRSGSVENAKALLGDHQATLGLSATPERDGDDEFENTIVPALGRVVYEYSYEEARRDGVIVDFELVNVEIALPEEEAMRLHPVQSRVSSLTRRSKATDDSLEKRAIESVARSAEAATRVPWAVRLALAHRDQRKIIFHERVGSLQLISDSLRRHGQNTVTYHSQLSDPHRRDNLRLFRRGAVNALVTCRALDEGANVPETNVAIIARSTSSTRQRIQRLGRVLRPAEGKEFATVYTLYANEEERERLAWEARDLQGVARVRWKKGRIG